MAISPLYLLIIKNMRREGRKMLINFDYQAKEMALQLRILLLQRTHVSITTTYNFSSKEINTFFWIL